MIGVFNVHSSPDLLPMYWYCILQINVVTKQRVRPWLKSLHTFHNQGLKFKIAVGNKRNPQLQWWGILN